MFALRAMQSCRWLAYCDGTSQTSDRFDPVVVGGQTIHLRGRALLDAHMFELEREHQFLSTASEVIISGSKDYSRHPCPTHIPPVSLAARPAVSASTLVFPHTAERSFSPPTLASPLLPKQHLHLLAAPFSFL